MGEGGILTVRLDAVLGRLWNLLSWKPFCEGETDWETRIRERLLFGAQGIGSKVLFLVFLGRS